MPGTRTVRTTAPARLHLGFLDLNGGLGRRFGSLGVALEQPAYRVRLTAASRLLVSGPDAARAERHARLLGERLGWPTAVRIDIDEAIPAHAGLGSGTQLALAVGLGMARLFDLPVTAAEIARTLGRGIRSGIGIAAFEQGGFIIDGGHRTDHSQYPQTLPPVLSRLAFPEPWRLLLIFDHHGRGLSGGEEKQAFTGLPEFPQALAAHLCHLTLMRALPALVEGDIHRFGAAIGEIQRHVGDHFAPAQGGRFASPAVTAVLDELALQGRTGLGQSSWGPTGFVLCANEHEARQLLGRLDTHRHHRMARLEFLIARPRNRPGSIELLTDTSRHGGHPVLVT